MLIQGMEKFERKYGFIPDFHDEHIESIVITADRIEMVIRTGDGTVSIILDVLFYEKEDCVETRLETSLGTEGFILAKEVRIEEE